LSHSITADEIKLEISKAKSRKAKKTLEIFREMLKDKEKKVVANKGNARLK
tara:strand:- start:1130 stop:1282 length:153 start_codon:yes stop_codon:yes gene_type:complete